MIGERIREMRQSQGRSLADVAAKAKISVATLSRIENDKQSVDVALFIVLAKVLQIPAPELLGVDTDNGTAVDPLVRRISVLHASDRADLWRELAAERRMLRTKGRVAPARDLAQHVDELMAHMDFVREELELVRKRVKKRG